MTSQQHALECLRVQLKEIAGALGCDVDVSQMLAAIESLKAAAMAPGIDDGTAALRWRIRELEAKACVKVQDLALEQDRWLPSAFQTLNVPANMIECSAVAVAVATAGPNPGMAGPNIGMWQYVFESRLEFEAARIKSLGKAVAGDLVLVDVGRYLWHLCRVIG